MKKLSSTKKRASKRSKATAKTELGSDHECFWRTATLKLASCVAATLQADGKIGMGSGMVMKVVDGKRIIERWDKDFIEALNFIGIEVSERPSRKERKTKRAAEAAA
jgi:hypothetical protein